MSEDMRRLHAQLPEYKKQVKTALLHMRVTISDELAAEVRGSRPDILKESLSGKPILSLHDAIYWSSMHYLAAGNTDGAGHFISYLLHKIDYLTEAVYYNSTDLKDQIVSMREDFGNQGCRLEPEIQPEEKTPGVTDRIIAACVRAKRVTRAEGREA